MTEKLDRAIIGVDGNCGFALLGANIQEGESEFVEIEGVDDPWSKDAKLRYSSTAWCEAASHAATRALNKLRQRLGYTIDTGKWLTYALDRSHPNAV